MDFNFGNNNNPENPDDENNNTFSFNPNNSDADTEYSVSDNSSPFEWTPNDTQDSDESIQSDDIDLDSLFSEDAKEESPQFVPDIPEQSLEEDNVVADDSNTVPEETEADEAIPEAEAFEEQPEDVPEAEAFEEQPEDIPEAEAFEEQPEDVPEAEAFEEQSEDVPEAEAFEEQSEDVPEAEAFEEQPEDALDAEEFGEQSEEAPETGFQMGGFENTVPAPAALDKRIRIPGGDQEYQLSELIDVETGEPLDLTSLIPAELLSATVKEATGGFSLGEAQPAPGGFDMSAGSEPAAPSKRKRPARPKAEKKKGGGILGIVMGGLLAFILFPYVMALIEMTTGAQSNIPIPAPGIPSTYKYIPEWWPDWAMFVFPGRTADNAAQTPAENPADKAAPAADEENANPADDAAAEDEAPADDAAAEDDGSFDPDAFLGNDGADNAAEPADVLADDEPVEPGVINAPQYTSADVIEAVANVGAAYKAAKKIDDTVYAALNDMAEKSTFVDTSAVDDQLKDAMSKVRVAMGNFGTKAALASALSEKWAARVEDESDDAGVMFVGTLSEVSQRDGYQIGAIDIEGQDSSVEVVGLRKIKPAVGDKVVVCGKRIANPGKNLGGFTDNGIPVVWGGIVIKAENK